MARVGFIGTGEIASLMVQGLAGQGHEIVVSDRNAEVAARLAATVPGLRVASNREVVAAADIVILCLLARVADEALTGLPFRAGQSVISVMVDVGLAKLQKLCAPATDIAITIPLPPIATGGCPLPVYPASPALEMLFGARNRVFTVRDEVALNAHFGATALCSPFLAQVLTTAAWLTEFTGDADQSQAYVRDVLRGYLPENGEKGHLGAALQSLSTEGGLNATLRAAMNEANADLRAGLDGFRGRLGLEGKKT
ncbi:NAD(P)-binding domain-containing protein [Tabrizicola oligotrophica]|uniref:NAD(P)-binding domain-containing protein n=1 Tax=Tabrizicola oligotrophica TaxID=2710650 RepID=A0A6M0QS79_9RHOB|nr:NAD(P)-binding domain-containing protein [Tabrizicola oligotrophica]NEY90287.1 NAD(P)-binding domain-containing protein [Tabrizicola oligotrophica]